MLKELSCSALRASTSSSSSSEEEPLPAMQSLDQEVLYQAMSRIRLLEPGSRSGFCDLRRGSLFGNKIMNTSPIFEDLNFENKSDSFVEILICVQNKKKTSNRSLKCIKLYIRNTELNGLS